MHNIRLINYNNSYFLLFILLRLKKKRKGILNFTGQSFTINSVFEWHTLDIDCDRFMYVYVDSPLSPPFLMLVSSSSPPSSTLKTKAEINSDSVFGRYENSNTRRETLLEAGVRMTKKQRKISAVKHSVMTC